MLLLGRLTNFLVIAQNKATYIFESKFVNVFFKNVYVAWPTKSQWSPYLNAFISYTVFTTVYSLILLKLQCLKEKVLNS